MGQCRICKQPAGLFRSVHKQCMARNLAFSEKIPGLFKKALASALPAQRFYELFVDLAREHHLDADVTQLVAAGGISSMIDEAVSDHVLSSEEDARITEMVAVFDIDVEQMELLYGAKTKLIKAKLLRDLESGQLEDRVHITGDLMPNLESNEKALWAYIPAAYYIPRTKTQYVGGSHGFSVRIMPGLYYRAGSFKGQPVRTEYLSHEGIGTLLVGSKNLYFVAPKKAVKIPMKRIVSVNLHDDGITIMAGATATKPHIFKIDDPPFAANILSRLA